MDPDIDATMQTTTVADRLKRFGFSEKEIAVYLAVVEEGRSKPATIASQADVSTSYVYQVCEHLENRGLVQVEDHFSPTLVTARSPSAAFGDLFEELEAIESAVERRYERSGEDEHSLELLQSRPTVSKRLRSLIEDAESEILMSVSHEALPEFRDELADAVDRGVLVLLVLNGPPEAVRAHDLDDVATVVRRGPRGLSVLFSADHDVGMISPASLLDWEHGDDEAVYYTKESVATSVIGSFLGNQWPMSDEVMARRPAELPREYDLFRPVVYDAFAHLRAGRTVWLEADATPIGDGGGRRHVEGVVVDACQSLLEPCDADFGFENALSIDTGEAVLRIGAEGAFLEDYQVSNVRLSFAGD